MTRARWLKRGALALGVLAGLRLLLAVGAHPVAGMVARGRGLELRWDSHALSLLDGAFEARGLSCGGDSTPPFLVVERIQVDVELRALLSGRLVVEQLEVDGLRLEAGLDADGRLRLGGGYDPARLAGSRESADAPATARPARIPAVLPLEVQRLRVRHAKLAWRDEGEGGEQEDFEFEVEGDHLLERGREGRLALRASAPRLLDGARVLVATSVEHDEHASGSDRTSVEVEARLAGLRTTRLANHLRRFGVVARGERIDGSLSAALELSDAASAGGAGGPRTRLAFDLRQAALVGDGAEAASVGLVAVRAEHDSAGLRIEPVRIDAPRARLELGADGIASFAGLGFDAERMERSSAASAAEAEGGAPGALELQAEGLALSGARLELVDLRASPARVHLLEDGALRLEIPPPGRDGARGLRMSATAKLPGVAQALEARAEGTLGNALEISLEAKASQVELRRLADLLAPLGLAPAERPADLTAKASLSARRSGANWTVDGRIDDLAARDGVHALSAGSVAWSGLSIGPRGVALDSLAWRGVEVAARRSADGALHLPLASWRGAPPESSKDGQAEARGAGAVGPAAGGAADPDPAAPELRIGRLELGARSLRFVDEAVQPATVLELADADFALDDLRAGGAGAQGARWSASARAPGLWSAASASGTLEVEPAWRVRLAARLRAEGLQPGHCQAYLTPLGLQALAGATDVAAAVEADLRLQGDEVRLSSRLSDARWTTGGVEQASCRSVSIDGLVAGPRGLDIDQLEVDGARLALRRDAQGGLQALGLRVVPRASASLAPSGAQAAPQDAPQIAKGSPAAGLAELLGAPPAPPRLPGLLLKRAYLRQATLALADEDPVRPFVGELVLSGEVLDAGTLAPAAPRARLEWALPPVCAKGTIELAARIEPDRHELTSAKLQVDGLDLQALAPWLPPGLDGRARSLSARVSLAANLAWQPALAAQLLVSEVEVVDRSVPDAPRVLARLDKARAALAEWSRGRLAFDSLELAGAELELERDERGGLHALGLVVGASAAAEGEPGRVDAAPAPLEPAPPASATAWRWRLDGWPQIELRQLDLRLRRVAWRDALLGGEPLELELEVVQSEPWIALAPRDGIATPWTVEARGALRPLVGDWRARLRLAAMQAAPALSASFEARGFDPAGLARVAPSLDGIVDLSSLANAEFGTGLEAKLSFTRRDERDFDWSNGLAAEIDVLPTALRDGSEPAGGRVLLGVDGVEVDVKRWSPRTGDLHIPRLVVRTPRALVLRDGMRVQVAGAWLDLARLAELQGSDLAPVADAPSVDGQAALPMAEAAAASSRPELRVDELSVEGLDLQLRDEGVDPPTVVPLADLDLSVRRFTTRMLHEPRSVRFTADLGSKPIPVPRRVGSHGLVAGVAKAVGGKLAGRREDLAMEERKLLEEASVSGRLQLVPEPRLVLRAGVSTLELLGLRGNAREAGVDVGDGLLDFELRARLVGEDFDLDTTTTVADLSLSEPKSGPIETYFALPMPLDAVLFLLKDSEDQIRVPVALSASTRGVGGAAIAGAAGRAAVAVVGRAVASAPLRVLKTFIDLDFESKGAPRAERGLVAFAPGTATLEGDAVAGLEPLLARLRSDPALRVVVQHRLSADDVRRLEQLANPSSADVLALQERLRSRRAQLQALHEELAADARAGQGAWRAERVAELRARWRAVVAELGAVEAALDELGELQRPGADRHRANRTRAAALLLGQRRLAAVAELLESTRVESPVECEVRAANLQVAEDETAGAVLVVLRRR